MAKEPTATTEEAVAPAISPLTDAQNAEPKTEKDLVPLAQTPETQRALAGLNSDLKVPTDLTKVSEAKAKELAEAGLVDDSDLPGKMYKRKADGFVTRIPDYTFNAYVDYMKDEWEEIKLASDEQPS